MVRFVSILEDLKEGRIQFVDLNLPSATKWAFMDVPRYFSLEEAIEQNESIPTIEQYKELFTNCRFSVPGRGSSSLIAESLNGRYVCFDCRGHFLQKIIIGYVYYWVRDLDSNTLKVLKMKNNKDYVILEYESIKTKNIKIKRVQST